MVYSFVNRCANPAAPAAGRIRRESKSLQAPLHVSGSDDLPSASSSRYSRTLRPNRQAASALAHPPTFAIASEHLGERSHEGTLELAPDGKCAYGGGLPPGGRTSRLGNVPSTRFARRRRVNTCGEGWTIRSLPHGSCSTLRSARSPVESNKVTPRSTGKVPPSIASRLRRPARRTYRPRKPRARAKTALSLSVSTRSHWLTCR
jgi:hypothetical protein